MFICNLRAVLFKFSSVVSVRELHLKMPQKVYVVGVGMTKFTKPSPDRDYPEMGKEAVDAALADAGIKYDQIQQAVCGYAKGDSTSGQRVLYQVGMTGIPIYNVNNNCSTGSTALFLAKQLIEGGTDVILAVGFEKMAPGALGASAYEDRAQPLDKHISKMNELAGLTKAPRTAQFFGNAGLEYMKKYGTTEEHVAKIAAKNHRHGAKNPRAQIAREYTVEEVMNARKIFGPLTKLSCCPTSDGAGAAVLMSEKAVIKHGLQKKAIEIIGMEMATDTPEVFAGKSLLSVVGYDMTTLAAKRLYQKTGISPKDVNVVELHDCFATNEMITYEGLQLCEVGKAGKFIDDGDNTYGGRVVVNPSGGLIAKGHPLGATGLAQCAELVWQLRGECGARQVSVFTYVNLEQFERRGSNSRYPLRNNKHADRLVAERHKLAKSAKSVLCLGPSLYSIAFQRTSEMHLLLQDLNLG